MAFSDKSCLFDGSNEYVTMGDVLGFERTDAFSFSLWFKTSSAAHQALVSKFQVANDGYFVDILAGVIRFNLWTLITNRLTVASTAATYADGNWHHLVVSYDGSSTGVGTFFVIDGVLDNGVTEAETISASILTSDPFLIGARNEAGYYFDGNIDEVAVYSKALSAAEGAWIWNGRSPRDLTDVAAPSNLVGWWRMGDGDTFPTLTDNSINTNDGTMVNMESGDIVDDTPTPDVLEYVDLDLSGQTRNPQSPTTGVKVSEPLTTYYRMRGIDITCPAIQQPAYVYWTVEAEPDYTASQLIAGDLPCGTDPLTDVADINIAGNWEA